MDKDKNIVTIHLRHDVYNWDKPDEPLGLIQISEWDDGSFMTIETFLGSSHNTQIRELDTGYWDYLSYVLSNEWERDNQ